MIDATAFERKRILVTGGLGFLGSNLVVRLAEAGARLTIIDASVPGCGANTFNLAPVASKVDVIGEDIGNPRTYEAKLRELDVIFNLAGEISHARSMEDPERDLYLNTVAQLRFLEACRRHRPGARVIYAGTRQVYGKPESLPVGENHPVRPIDFNGVHKHAAAQYHLLFAKFGDLDCAVLRLSNVYGPRMALHLPQQGFLGVYLRCGLLGEPVVYYGDGAQLRDPVYVDDAVDAFLCAGAAAELRSRTFNVGGLEAYSIREIAGIVAAESGVYVKQAPFPEHMARIDIGSYISDNSRIRRELGWRPKIAFRQGVQRSLAYFRAHLDRYLGIPDTPVARPAAGRAASPASAR